MYNLDINKGDIILTGKWKNKKEKVKTFGHDKNMQPTINGKSMLKFRIEKLMPKKEIKEMKKMKRSELKAMIKECIQEIKLGSHGFAPIENVVEEGGRGATYVEDAWDALDSAVREFPKGSKERAELTKAWKITTKIMSALKRGE